MSVVLAYKNFAASRNISHIGLGVAAINTAKVLRRAGIQAEVWPIVSAGDLRKRLRDRACTNTSSSPRLGSRRPDLQLLSNDFPKRSSPSPAIRTSAFSRPIATALSCVREMMEIELGTVNVHLAGNSRRFCDWINAAFGAPCAYLPNLYYLESNPARPQQPFAGGTLRIGVFGATRPLKNLMSAAAAALEISRELCVFRSNCGFPPGAPRAAVKASCQPSRKCCRAYPT